jgi:hypothetical protein
VHERARLLVGHRSHVVAEHDRPQERLEPLEGLERRGLGVQPALDVDEPRCAQALRGALGRREHLSGERIGAELLEHAHHAGEVPGAAALPDEASTGPEHGREIGEQRVVIGDPVEGRGRQDGVHGLVDRERAHQVGEHEPDPIAERREPAPRDLEHRCRAVERDHGAVGEPFGEERRDASRTAPGVQDGLVPVELEPVDHGRTPSELRVGDRVVGLGVPVARHGGNATAPSEAFIELAPTSVDDPGAPRYVR